MLLFLVLGMKTLKVIKTGRSGKAAVDSQTFTANAITFRSVENSHLTKPRHFSKKLVVVTPVVTHFLKMIPSLTDVVKI